MNAVRLSADIETWIEAEVAGGSAADAEQVVDKALRGYRAALEDFHQSLDDAVSEADREGWLTADEVFGPIEAELKAAVAEEKRANPRSA